MYLYISLSLTMLTRRVLGLMLQKSKASPFFGLTETPFLLLIPLASGNTVSPPLSTSELISYTMTEKRRLILCISFFTWLMRKIIRILFMVYIQIHKNSSNSLKSVKVRLKFLPNFIMDHLKRFSVFCT